jgi:membrane-bound metal-dependent hydrolase YbcI (DUF457 family)
VRHGTTEYFNMANGSTHRLAAALVVGSACLYTEINQPAKSAKPFVGAGLAAMLTNLPDIIEPASHPNHRQFFHSLAFAGLLVLATRKVYNWKTDNSFDEAVRFVLLVGSGAYLVHLLLDSGTAKSLPVIGKF